MSEPLADHINIIKIYVAITFLTVLVYRRQGKYIDDLLLIALAIAVFNEVLSLMLISMGKSVALNTNLYVICNNVLWLLILLNLSVYRSVIRMLIILYLIFATTLLLVFANPFVFNHYVFIVGALIYIVMFLTTNLRELRSENLKYFYSVDYLLITAPVLFFIGFSMIFGFRIKHLDTVIVMGAQFYDWISYFVNFVFYSIINLYIFRQYRLKNVN